MGLSVVCALSAMFYSSGVHFNSEKRQALYVERNIEVRSCNHCCSGKAISVTYSESMYVALVSSMQCACVILSSVWSVRLYIVFPHYLTKGTIFEIELLNMEFMF